MDKLQEKALVCDAKDDILHILNIVTDEHRPCPDATHKFSIAYEKLFSVAQELTNEGVMVSESNDWGNADTQAKSLFENLAKHYMGFWKYTAEYQSQPNEQNKKHMLTHFEHQLKAHDAMAAFVMGRCEVLCPEIKQVLATWRASKKTA